MIEWGSYLDQSMPETERNELKQRLEREPELKKELEGYQLFVLTLQNSALEERVPTDHLERMLSDIVGAKKKKWWQLPIIQYGTPIAATCAAIAFLVMTQRPPSQPPSFDTASYDNRNISTGKEAADWIKKRKGWDVPNIALTGLNADFSLAEIANDWACCDFKINRSIFCLRMSPTVKLPAEPNYVGKGGMQMVLMNGVYWKEGKYTMYLLGGSSKEERIAIAEAIHRENGNIARLPVKDLWANFTPRSVNGQIYVFKM